MDVFVTHTIGPNSQPVTIKDPHELYERRMHELYGKDYERLKNHKPNNPEVNKLLVDDALKTGKWEELPDQLQSVYHRRKGNK